MSLKSLLAIIALSTLSLTSVALADGTKNTITPYRGFATAALREPIAEGADTDLALNATFEKALSTCQKNLKDRGFDYSQYFITVSAIKGGNSIVMVTCEGIKY